jgi:glycosyltransferase involved in cell wall biosynthesis
MTPRDLFVSTFSPRLGNGRDLRTYTVIRALAAHGPIDVLYVAYGGPPAEEFAADPTVTLHEIVKSRGPSRALLAAGIRARGWPWGIARACAPEFRATALRLAASEGRGRVIAGDWNAMAMLMPFARRRPVIYNAHNVESSYEVNPYEHRSRWRSVGSLEKLILRTASESWMVSRRDVELAHELVPSARLRYVPNVVDARAITPIATPVGGDTVLMVADFSYEPNVRSARWLLDEVLPRVWERRPQVRLRLTGRDLELPDADPRIEVTGFVPDIRAAYAEASAVVVPLIQGAGTPLKFIEALAYGQQVVATPLAARGLELTPGTHFRLAEDAEAMATAIVDVLTHPDPQMGLAARAVAEREYSVQTLIPLVASDRELPTSSLTRPHRGSFGLGGPARSAR